MLSAPGYFASRVPLFSGFAPRKQPLPPRLQVVFGNGATSDIASQVQVFRKDLITLIDWDRRTHAIPVFEEFCIRKICEGVENFLKRRDARDVSHPVPFIIGLAGGTASGKSFVKNMLVGYFPKEAEKLFGWSKRRNGPAVEEIEMDHFYRDLSERRKKLGDDKFFRKTNLDTSKALTLRQFILAVKRLVNGAATRIPEYDMRDSTRKDGFHLKVPAPFVFLEGMFTFSSKQVRRLLDLSIFIHTPDHVRRERWWKRAPERNVKPDKAGYALFNQGEKMHRKNVLSTKPHAALVINGAARKEESEEALQKLAHLFVQHLYPSI